jgi:hypothetical protein
MNQRIYLLILFFSYCSIAFSQTNVSGFINANTTWDLAGSPYIVTGNILVSHGFTLTIDPGVVVKFDTAKTIQIEGQLIAIGNAANRIKLIANQPSSTNGYWGSMQFSDASVDAVYNSNGYYSGCTLQFCDILNGGAGNYGAIYVINSHPYFSNCTIAYSGKDGIQCTGGSVIVDSCTIKNCNGMGLRINSPVTLNCNWKIQNNTFEFNNGGGMNLFQSNCQSGNLLLTVSNNSFKGNSQTGGLTLINGIFNVSHNTFEDNTANAMNQMGTGLSIEEANFIIECNLFKNNNAYYRSAAAFAEARPIQTTLITKNIIRNNIFEDNFNNSNHVENSALHVGADHNTQIYIENNYFRNNSEPGGSLCYLIGNTYNNQATRFNVRNNEFQNNLCQSDVFVTSNGLGSGPNMAYISLNNFVNPTSQYAINNNLITGSPNLSADSNYWNSTSTQHVDSVIYDFFDNSNNTIVYYTTVLPAPVSIDTNSCTTLTGIINIDEQELFKIFPNPVNISISIVFDKIIHSGRVDIFNILGEKVLHENIDQESKKVIDLQSVSNGICLVKLFDGEKYFCKKIIVEHN